VGGVGGVSIPAIGLGASHILKNSGIWSGVRIVMQDTIAQPKISIIGDEVVISVPRWVWERKKSGSVD